MKKILSYIVILSLSLFVFGCDSTLIGGPTIDESSDEYDYIETNRKGITTYKGEPFNGSVTGTHENGQLSLKSPYKDGRRDGVEESYYENGQLEEKITFKDGEPNGTYEEYYENGQLREKRTYKDGNRDGDTEYYRRNGQPQTADTIQ